MMEVWDEQQLMGLAPGESPPPTEPVPEKAGRRSSTSMSIKGKGVDTDPLLWGLPGHLNKEESDTFFKFKEEVEKRGGEFRETVFCFGVEEGECWALCRWLRARKFVYDDVIKMVEQATETRKDARDKAFYPNPVDALGVDPSLFFAMYPQLYTGFAKTGVPLYISKPGILNVDGMECITTLDGIIKFHWHIMMHDFANRLRAQKAKDPDNFKRFECFCILDLDHLTTSQLSSRALAIIKEQSAIDSVCFPETMNKMLIINAPTFFAASWRMIKGWLDPRTAAKIEVISSKSAGEKRLLELVDEDQLPCDYGGKGPDTNITIMESFEGNAAKLDTKMMYVRGHSAETVEVAETESVDVTVYTRSNAGAKFIITDAKGKTELTTTVEVLHDSQSELPASAKLTTKHLEGPASLKVKAVSNAGRFSRHDFLLVLSHYKK